MLCGTCYGSVIHLSSDTTCLETASDPTALGLSPTRLPLIPSLGSIKLLEQLTQLRETVTLTSMFKDTVEDTQELADEETHRLRSGRVAIAGTSVPGKLA